MLRQRRQRSPDAASSSSSTTSSAPPTPPTAPTAPTASTQRTMQPEPSVERRPLLADDHDRLDSSADTTTTSSWLQRNQWVALAITSGACAAFNGVFAKLTTTELTSRLSRALADLVGLDAAEPIVDLVVRGTFFILNLVFNGVMWTLFTRALACGHSATQVAIMNTSTNFVLTALLGLAIFSERLPPLWWAGATMLVAGNVIIGQKSEAPPDTTHATDAAHAVDPHAVDAAHAVDTAGTVNTANAANAAHDTPAATTAGSPPPASVLVTAARRSSRIAAQHEPSTVASSSTSVSDASVGLTPSDEKEDDSD